MQIVRNHEELTRSRRLLEGRLALVPTMGALHAGHLALVAEARNRADKVAVTIFVNPTQFGKGEDFGRYPRQEEKDSQMLEQAGCDLLWAPSVADIYPDGFASKVSVGSVSQRWEGEARPGHFDGVTTIVTKLLLSVRPNVALFGEKDFQQLAVIRRMGIDLNLGVDIVGVATVRESDGLALSSRNSYLLPEERQQAAALPRALQAARAAIRAGSPVPETLHQARASLRDSGFARIDYCALVDASSLEPLQEAKGDMRLIVAAVIGDTRLIDNIAV